MTALFMFLLANDYGISGFYSAFLCVLMFLIICLIRKFDKKNIKKWAKLFLFVALFIFYGDFFIVSPAKIPEYGTNIQKAKMTYCMQKYTQSKHVDLKTITQDDTPRIMKQCWIEDHSDKNTKEDFIKI